MGNEQSHNLGNLTSKNYVTFLINGKEYIVPGNQQIGAETLLVDYIRDYAHLKGTKFMCREGGCGACVVTVRTKNAHTGMETIRAVNSCLIPVYACDGWEITTIEYLGSKTAGYHPIQQRFAKLHGTQCGFCTPGWIMNFYSAMQSKPQITVADIEDITDGNICRCTGYRPILDSAKSFAVDAPEDLKRKCAGMAPAPLQTCQKYCDDFENIDAKIPIVLSDTSNIHWVKATDMKMLFETIQRFRSNGLIYRVVGGNTGTGVYKNDGPYQAFVQINSIHQLQRIDMGTYTSTIIIGGAVTIAAAITALENFSNSPGFEYCKEICKHWKRVANVSVRNFGTLAGNLMLKHKHPEFPSDIFLVLETIGATLTISSSPSLQQVRSIAEFLGFNMNGKIIYSIHFPKLDHAKFRSFKITRRYQSSHAYVNAGFLFPIDGNLFIKKKPAIVFGGISPGFVHASSTEEFLIGKTLNDETLKGAIEALEKELNPDVNSVEGGSLFRKKLAQALLYKFIVGLLGDAVEAKIKSSCMDIERGPVYGKQSYEFDKSEWPLKQPVQKLEAPIQCSGEAEYTNDIPPFPCELHATIVLATVAKANIKSVDTSQAMKLRGVVAWVDHKDIPGINNYMVGMMSDKPDHVFLVDKVQYAGQPVGVIIAETLEIAKKARKLVKIEYDIQEKPMINLHMVLKSHGGKLPISAVYGSDYHEKKSFNSTHNISGELNLPGQFHFPLEIHVCIGVPREGELDLYLTAQCVDFVGIQVGYVTGMPRNSINVITRRLGGAFGNKINRVAQTAAICAVATLKVRRPVRLLLDMETTLSMYPGRLPYLLKYEAGFEDDGKISNVHVSFFSDTGCTTNEVVQFLAPDMIQSVYNADPMTANLTIINTDLPPHTFSRCPAAGQAVACIETVMDHIAFVLKKDPIEVRMMNLMKEGDGMFPDKNIKFQGENMTPKMFEELKVSGDIEERQKFIDTFNKENRWKKRGLAMIPARFVVHYIFSDYKVHVSIYGSDGTVGVAHSGIEMGQAINTKIAQVVARNLGVPLDLIKIKLMDSNIAANATFTGTGATTENLCYAAIKASEILVERLKPVREKLGNPTWQQLAAECKKLGMDLTSSYATTFADKLIPYGVWGVSAAEVEIDCLTGEHRIIRVDLTSDGGQSISPDVDIGQVEGAFIMGLGWLLSEKIIHDEKTGELLTNRTWNYKPPTAKDVPADFRVSLLKNETNPAGVLGSKSLAEAPFILCLSVFFAMRKAIFSARMDAGNNDWFQMDGPLTPEDIQRLCLTDASQFTLSNSNISNN